eukprot:15434172-Alexandrium_andersonii.AAC.1
MARDSPGQLAAIQQRAHATHRLASQAAWGGLASSGVLGLLALPPGAWLVRNGAQLTQRSSGPYI